MQFHKMVTKEVKLHSRTLCDRCGVSFNESCGWEENTVGIERRHGSVYPECDTRKLEILDCCQDCWEKHARPALEAAGFKFQERHAEDPYSTLDPNPGKDGG